MSKKISLCLSSKDQKEERQVKEMLNKGVDENNIVVEKASGKPINRNKYDQLVKQLSITSFFENPP